MNTGRLLDSTVAQRSFACMDGSQMCVAPSAHIDGAIQLQSVSLQTENIDVDSDWTLMFWFKAGVGQRPLLSFRRDEANLVTLFVNGEDRLILRVRKGTLGQPFFNEDKDLSTIDLNAWHHLTIRASNNRVTYSLNGASFLDAGNDPIEAQAARIILGAPSSEAHFDEVWLGKVETDAPLTIYRNQSGALEPEVTRVP